MRLSPDGLGPKKLLTSIFLTIAAGAAVLGVSSYFFNAAENPATTTDPLAEAQKIVSQNQAKPCAEAAGKISALLLSDPNLKCDGAKVLAP